MYGQMTAGSWIYIGTQGILQGTYETFVAAGRTHFGTDDLAGRLGPHGRASAAWAARSRSPRRWRRRPSSASRSTRRASRSAASTRATSTSAATDLDEALRRLERARGASGRPLSVGLVGNAADVYPRARPARRSRRTSSPTRPRAHDPAERLRAAPALSLGDAAALRGDAIPRGTCAARRRRWRGRSRRCSRCRRAGQPRLRLRQQHPRGRAGGRGSRTPFDYPGLRAGLHPADVLRGARARSAGSRCRAIPRTSRRPTRAVAGLFPENAGLRRWLDLAARKVRVPGAAGPDLLARLRRARPGRARVQRARRARQGEGAHRHRPRPPRLRLGRLAEPRDRGDARRLGRDRRLADPERARERRERRVVGELPPRRRRRDRAARSTRAR